MTDVVREFFANYDDIGFSDVDDPVWSDMESDNEGWERFPKKEQSRTKEERVKQER